MLAGEGMIERGSVRSRISFFEQLARARAGAPTREPASAKQLGGLEGRESSVKRLIEMFDGLGAKDRRPLEEPAALSAGPRGDGISLKSIDTSEHSAKADADPLSAKSCGRPGGEARSAPPRYTWEDNYGASRAEDAPAETPNGQAGPGAVGRGKKNYLRKPKTPPKPKANPPPKCRSKSVRKKRRRGRSRKRGRSPCESK